jgi:2-polyprenyl-6-methoxyphenol hydroxylase-like FAD-dependent oxidoreductase
MLGGVDRIVVVGAGIGGLAASIILSRGGAHVTLVERSERASEVGAALALQANGMAVLDRLGLLGRVAAESSRIDRMDIRTTTGRLLLSSAMPDFGGGLDHALAVRRTVLHRLLLDAATSSDGVETRFGCKVVRADADGSVTLDCSSQGVAPVILRADLVVGADGAGSAVRGTGGFVSRVSQGSTYVRTLVSGRLNGPLAEYWTPLGSFGHAPLGNNAAYVWAAADAAAVRDAVTRRHLAAFVRAWAAVLPLAVKLGSVASFDDLLINTVRRVDCRRWFSGRLVLLGDAAHAMAPNLGQGANSALVDAVVLADALVGAPSVEEALRRYDERRRPAARRVQNVAGLLQRLCRMDDRLAVGVRDSVLAPAGRLISSGATVRRALLPDVETVRSALR